MRKLLFILCTLSILVQGATESEAASNEAVERNNLGASLLEQGKVDEAIAEFRKAVERNPKYVAAQLNLGYAYDRRGQTEEAMAQYQKVIALEPGNFFAHNNLGVLYDKKGLYEEAAASFGRAVEIDPSNDTASENLERAKRNKGVVKEREDRFAEARRAVEANPNDPRAAYTLGRLFASYGKKEQAFEWLAKALELGFDDVKFLKDDPALVPLQDDPRFTGLLGGR
jgi:superkiller protein 3